MEELTYSEAIEKAKDPEWTDTILEIFRLRPLYLLEPYQLKPHQLKVMTWMREREEKNPRLSQGITGGIVKLEMGMGKSLISAGFVQTMIRGDMPTLIVCSKTVMSEWKSQVIKKFFHEGTIKALFFHKDFINKIDFDTMNREKIKTYDIVFTTYDTCLTQCNKGNYYNECVIKSASGQILEIINRTKQQADQPAKIGGEILYCTPWYRIIADESQRFANPKTKIAKAMMALYGEKKWTLTGTPIRNTDVDLFTQLRWLGYDTVTTPSQWKRRRERFLNQDARFLKTVIYSMNYEDAGIEMPPLINKSNALVFGSNEEKEVYDMIHSKTKELFNKFLLKLVTFECILKWFLYLRLCAIAPFLLTDKSKRELPQKGSEIFIDALAPDTPLYLYMHDKQGTAGIQSTKMIEILRLVKEYTSQNKKVLIFSMFTRCLDLVASVLDEKAPELRYEQLIGECNMDERERILALFRETNRVNVLLLNYKVGGEGINLTCSEAVIFVEPWWNDAVHSQARSRAWRFGQTKPVSVDYLYIKNTVEQKVFDICLSKLMTVKTYFPETDTEDLEAIYSFSDGKVSGNGAGLNVEQMRNFLF